ncbi:4'-phosphopantetheinyl transferase family protein [Pedobacter agri]|uniref:4'-phosphopantetheinyl transferase family protein n=1 Tax=Pedobacter agri TaxID=454586 RepID=UPI00292CB735|nr:4'-phosphopantetheinyl transferase superfamily protein [Pedobacter agri]
MNLNLKEKYFSLPKLQFDAIDSIDYTSLACDYIIKIDIGVYYEKIKDDYREILSVEEVEKALKFRSIDDANRFICTRYGIRNILSFFMNISPKSIVFQLGFNNKPYLEGIEFNITHCADLVIFAISKNPIGIDIEFCKKDFDFNGITAITFTKPELKLLKNGPYANQTFYWLWTRKEALLKATGEGLIDQINEISVLKDQAVRFTKTYNFYSFKVSDDYIGCMASSSLKSIRCFNYT